ncbi:peptidylprolyl isomerase [Arthrospiribacter ruber]|uniref:Peptidylprolyl isomerase n=1 Tax=Arthrospiribacter ruber TaxID=2487934 RepID=A0A951IYF2_9BACT|nr:peptidylprolyl isomerase [Arthrospiribacter ruber]MBW3467733.1 peptidylprolyl isomerase [Arthrospiribacter ruber]
MNKKYFWYSILVLVLSCSPKTTLIQEESKEEIRQPLLTIEGEEIFAEEFLHLLSKNREFQNKGEKLSPEDFQENFDLFVNYKLKVKEAEKIGLDTLEDFRKEFDVFKQDLIKPYLIQNSLREGELQKAYNRMNEVVKASHILLQFPANASHDDSVAVLRMALKLKEEAEKGADFNQLALEHSDDPSAKDNKGSLGYFTALQMVYQFEDAAYGLEVGEISDPVLTNFGYHIIKLEDRKPNPGEIRVSHILVRSQSGDPVSEERALRKVGDIYTELQKPESVWEEVCELYSEDVGSKNSGGKLPWLGLGSVIPEFERVAFGLTEIGEISSPVKTPYGFHIIRLEDKKPIASFEDMEAQIKSRILRDSRSNLIQSQVTAIQKSRYDFTENTSVTDKIEPLFDRDINVSRKKFEENQLMDSILFETSYGPSKVSDFIDFLDSDRAVIRYQSGNAFETAFEKFVAQTLNETEEKDLTANNEEFRLLLQEYRDGILLFSLMNDQVWQKALQDEDGQIEFYENHKDRYTWQERAEAITVSMAKEEKTSAVRRFLSDKVYKSDLADRLENTFLLDDPLAFSMEEGIYEIQSHPILSKADLSKSFQELKHNNKTTFVVIGNKVPAGPKKFDETRGKVVQDYQEHLDKKLVASLKEAYQVQINEDEKKRIYDRVVAD